MSTDRDGSTDRDLSRDLSTDRDISVRPMRGRVHRTKGRPEQSLLCSPKVALRFRTGTEVYFSLLLEDEACHLSTGLIADTRKASKGI